jgi:hypothetical protein
MTRRRLALLLGLLFLLAGAVLATGPPRFTWMNLGLRIDYPWPRAAGAIAAAAGAMLLGFLFRRRSLRIVIWVAAAVALGHGLDLLVYRVDAGDATLAERGLLGTTAIAWKDVSRVETGSRALVITDRDEAQIRLRTAAFAPEDRARLERTIARHVREAGAGR